MKFGSAWQVSQRIIVRPVLIIYYVVGERELLPDGVGIESDSLLVPAAVRGPAIPLQP